MPTQLINSTRRQLLKVTACTSALSIVGLSSLSNAASSMLSTTNTSDKSTTLTLFNQSDKQVLLDAKNPVSLAKVNGWVVVNINKAVTAAVTKESQIITLAAGQTQTFEVNSELASLLAHSGDYIVITEEYSALNNVVPISTYDALVA